MGAELHRCAAFPKNQHNLVVCAPSHRVSGHLPDAALQLLENLGAIDVANNNITGMLRTRGWELSTAREQGVGIEHRT